MSEDVPVTIPIWLTTTIYAIILVLCVAGNLTVILIVALRRDMHTVPNIFITSLSVSDLLIGLVVLTFTIIQINGLMTFSKVSCILPVYFDSVAITASVYSLVAVTFDRYKAVVLATSKVWTLSIGIKIIVAVWMASFVFSAKLFFSILVAEHGGNGDSDDDDEDPKFCNLMVEEDDDDLYYRIADFVVLFIIPIVLMTFMYSRIAKRLWVKSMAITSIVRSKRRIIKFLITDVVLFFFSWLPFYMIDIITDSINMAFNIDDNDTGAINKTMAYTILRFMFTVLAFTNCVVNPIVYAYFNQNFRMELVKIRRKFHCAAKVEPSSIATFSHGPSFQVPVTVSSPLSHVT